MTGSERDIGDSEWLISVMNLALAYLNNNIAGVCRLREV